ncbi:Catechol 2,3-dioxygenase [Pseudonocardia thermophila]|jgi:Lactoylglutathione lyase and related lyases|uniref:Catechol 2,3-dioxygenase n=1 Tax=Pseudonocardia thermophila TaxID=1848 RepID=A0A1M6SC77_PSETH|nr:VOC family protein [Pseudonocardia thermophila]SHK42276.1 Catechol 2,3-dioxygenase [Pseudonocardia thermophila]
MITAVSIVSVFVKDVDAAKEFYTDVLGFSEHTDITLGDGYRWCTVRSATQPELQVHLTEPGPPIPDDMVAAIKRAQDAGDMFGLGMHVDDCRKTYEELREKGVEFIQPPQDRPYGVEAVARDNSGNWMVLVEPKPFTPADFE